MINGQVSLLGHDKLRNSFNVQTFLNSMLTFGKAAQFPNWINYNNSVKKLIILFQKGSFICLTNF